MAAPGATASIGRLACRVAVPRDGTDGAALRDRVDRVLGGRLATALGAALAQLDEIDDDAVWVVRSMQAPAVVSATDEDLDRLAAQLADQLGRAIIAVIRAGPGGNVVRFATRAEYLAAFADALARGRGDAWMFEPLAGLRLLGCGAAIRTGAARAGIAVTAVLAELVAAGRLEVVLAAMRPVEADAVWAACVEESRAGAAVRGELLARVRALADDLGAEALLAAGHGVSAVRLLGAAVAQLGVGPDVVLAVDIVAGTNGAPDPGVVRRTYTPLVDDAGGLVRAGDGRADGIPRAQAQPVGTGAARGGAADGRVFAAAGAPAFLLAPALERIGLAAEPARARTAALARALRLDPDDAVRLAGGDTGGDGGEIVPEELAAAVRRALAGDGRIDGRWLLTEVVAHPDGRRRVAAVRDAVSDVWLAGALLEPGSSVPWTELLDAILADTADTPLAIVGVRSSGAPSADAECDAALAGLRPLADDLAWLTPRDDGELAASIAARAAARDLARRLMGFGRSSMGYLAERFLPAGGVVAETVERIHADLAPAPLSVILVMAGLDRAVYAVPWLAQEVLVTHRSG